MANCSLVEDFLKEKERLCNSTNCIVCPMYNYCDEEAISRKTKEAIFILQRWSDDHPKGRRRKQVDKIVETKTKTEIEFGGATLLTAKEAENLLTIEERTYSNWWWLRSPGRRSDLVATAYSNGNVSSSGSLTDLNDTCIRPALRILNLELPNFRVGDKFEIDGWRFKIISKDLAWLYEQDIGYELFRKNCFADDANDYEKSDVKIIVDKWYENLIGDDKND